MRLENKVAIITGAGTGLGLAIAKCYAAEGAKIVIADLAGQDTAVAAIRDAGGNAIAIEVDVSHEDQVEMLVAATLTAFGSIDILVNNAAIASSLKPLPFEELTVDQWHRIFDVNVIGVFLCCRAVARQMRLQKFGRIINLASGTAFKGTPGFLHYIASKGAVITMTRGLAHELGADNILVNAIAPGFTLSEGNLTNNELTGRNRAVAIGGRAIPRDAYPEDIVGAALFFASNDSCFVTGQIMAVDGGSVYH